MLRLDGLNKFFGGLPALQDVCMSVPAGQLTALIGPNGAGKSTLINCMTGVLSPTSGSIRFMDQEIAGLPAHRITRLGIHRTFQNLRLFPRLSVLDNVLTGLTREGGESMFMAMLRLPYLRHRERRLRLRALEAMDQFGLADKAGWPAGVLAYGDKKRVELARAIVGRPKLLLLDEPVAGLNAEETAAVGEQLRNLRRAGHTILLVEHDMDLVMNIADLVVVLDSGCCIATGTADEVRRNPLVLEAYLGRMEATA
ncbi:ABC-type branched-subunit amino acid transport system ATPase component [Desulfomicrobium macestii]|uniref:Amino acid/amide ABC transporter ATP-binding protein 1, HAAT family n=2 Tax=Desulfomicrobium TaxID=898 RepID=A0A8G2C2U0_DESNO|nr:MULTISPECIES: ABC transporter ATP-binding protein [Desulfomicrobium]MBE1425221.1 ABC-type branched-subunit amino acid transport system ATPase component [Desulfomicrobium macestii]SFL70944.1 amino acid/amide ABC transporter ATP-binding protein 1, HAAT family [Desulfomicrobium norvegicum]